MIDTSNVTVNAQSSIRFAGRKIVYIDPFQIYGETHDADLILITHPHYDHFSPEDIGRVSNFSTRFIVPKDLVRELDRIGVSPSQITTISAGQTLTEGQIRVEAVPAYNEDKAFHAQSMGWIGYILTIDDVRYYVAGDTDALEENTKLECDVAFVPIGGTYTMDAKEAAAFVNALHPIIAVPIHYGDIVGHRSDFDVFREAVDKDIEVLRKLP